MAPLWCVTVAALIALSHICGAFALQEGSGTILVPEIQGENVGDILKGHVSSIQGESAAKVLERGSANPVLDCKSVIVHNQIQSRLNALSSAFANNDLEAVLRLYAEDVVVMPPGRDLFKGKTHPAFEELCLARMKEICNCTTIYDVQEAVVPTGEEGGCGNAFVRDSFSMLNSTTQDTLAIQAGYQTTLWDKPDGTWVIKWVTWTNVNKPSPESLPPQHQI